MTTALDNGMEDVFRTRNEELINMIVGNKSDLYQDYNGNDQFDDIEEGTSNGYGSLPNGDQAGYLQQTALESQAAANAPDATPNIRQQNEVIQVCIQNMKVWTDQILPLALELQRMEFGPEMQPTLDEMTELGIRISNGWDADGSGRIEPIEGECGAIQVYNAGKDMADFLIFPGPSRLPPTAVPTAQNN
jgi:hypothetical protein